MISYKAKKKELKKNTFKQLFEIGLIIFCSLILLQESSAQSTLLWGTNASPLSQPVDSVIAIGVNAGRLNQGAKHIFIGTNAGYHLNYQPLSALNHTTSGPRSSGRTGNIHIGYYAGYFTTTGDDNLFIGEQAGYRNKTGADNTFIGNFSGLNNTGTDNTFIGFSAGLNNTTGYDNTFLGEEAGIANTSGRDNVFVGEDAGARNTTGYNNSFIGSQAGVNNTTGYRNAFLGNYAGYDNTTGDHNTFIGDSAGVDVSVGIYNTFIGAGCGTATEFTSYNTFVGAYAGSDNNRTNQNSGATRNTYMGYLAGFTNREGSDNTGIGCLSDFVSQYPASTNISNTVFLGASASVAANGVVVLGKSSSGSGENGIAIGHQSSMTASNAIAIGYQASATTANEVVIGNAAHTSIGGSVNWTATSDGRFKTDVQEDVVGLDFINQLRPVTYHFDSKKIMEHKAQTITRSSLVKEVPADLDSALLSKNTIRYTGFIAQEVEQAAQMLTLISVVWINQKMEMITITLDYAMQNL